MPGDSRNVRQLLWFLLAMFFAVGNLALTAAGWSLASAHRAAFVTLLAMQAAGLAWYLWSIEKPRETTGR